jgi:hypothetical protein
MQQAARKHVQITCSNAAASELRFIIPSTPYGAAEASIFFTIHGLHCALRFMYVLPLATSAAAAQRHAPLPYLLPVDDVVTPRRFRQ